jgi:hypothetical protein
LRLRQYARDICEFGDRTSKHNTFSLFITRACSETIEKLFLDFLIQAFRIGIIDLSEAIIVCNDSTFIKAYSRRGRKGGIRARGARVGRLIGEAKAWMESPRAGLNEGLVHNLHC